MYKSPIPKDSEIPGHTLESTMPLFGGWHSGTMKRMKVSVSVKFFIH